MLHVALKTGTEYACFFVMFEFLRETARRTNNWLFLLHRPPEYKQIGRHCDLFH